MTLDIIGNIAILHFPEKPRKIKKTEKIKIAKKILQEKKNIKTVLEKSGKVSGRLRTLKTRFLAGEKTLEALYRENGCVFKLNVETCYFSSRLAEERKQVSGMINKTDRVLVMFAGVAPFPVVIAKNRGANVVSLELSRECEKYARENIKINHVADKVEIIQGDVKKLNRVVEKGKKKLGKFDIIVMPRPNLRETFLNSAFSVSKKGTLVFYYCFGREEDLNKSLEEIYKIAKRNRKKIQVLRVKKAGDIAPFKWRWRVDFKIV